MNVEEQRLAEWLHQVTPEPPHVIGVEDVAPQLRASRRWWVPVVVAAAVAVLVAGVTIGLRGTHRTTPPAHPASPTATGPGPTTSVANPTPAPAGLPVHPWHATQLGRLAALGTVVLDGRLYALADWPGSPGSPGSALYRLDPDTGAPLARAADRVFGHPVAAAGLIWCLSARQDAVLGFAPLTLSAQAHVAVSVPSSAFGPSLATLGATTLVVGAGNRLVLIRHGSVVRELVLDGKLAPAGIAAATDGSRLFVLVQTASMTARLETLDPDTGAAVAPPKTAGGGVWGLHATSGGLWFDVGPGHEESMLFWPYRAASPRIVSDHSSGGGLDVAPSVSGGAVWLGGYGFLACADPATGAIRASVPVGTDASGDLIGSFGSLTVLHRKVYAAYTGVNPVPFSALVVMTPPAACFTR